MSKPHFGKAFGISQKTIGNQYSQQYLQQQHQQPR
jgi:hypothetical protein